MDAHDASRNDAIFYLIQLGSMAPDACDVPRLGPESVALIWCTRLP